MSINGNSSPRLIESQQILDLLADGIIFSDQDGIIVYTNEAAGHLTGIPTDNMLGRPITDILTRLPLLSDSAAQFELNGRHVQGKAATVPTPDGVAQGILTTLRDVTAEHEAEQAKSAFLWKVANA